MWLLVKEQRPPDLTEDIEPFWIAANVLLVRKAGAAESGDDLRVWFEELQRS